VGLSLTSAEPLPCTFAYLTTYRIMMLVCMSSHHETIALKSLMLNVTSTVS
jgi:hypothetical protein